MKKKLLDLFCSLIFSFEVFGVLALTVHLTEKSGQLIMLAGALVLSFLLFFIIRTKTTILKGFRGFLSLLIIPLIFGSGVGLSYSAIKNNTYRFENVDNGKSEAFANRNVLVVVPHQDDETFLFGGVFEEYIKYGSKVNVVFSTNGDAMETAETKGTRLKEAIKALQVFGVDEDNIYFLGYGDTWDNDKSHIYLSEGGKLMTSTAGYTATYALPDHPAFNDGADYTRDNFKSDMKNLIMKIQPDTIYCVDYDKNSDHRATSLIFEEAMGEILKENKEYRPLVYKGFAYSTSMYAVRDYNGRNVKSTVNPYDTEYMQETNVYNWNERVRIPVSADSLSRLSIGTSIYEALDCHVSQSVCRFTHRAANSDRVFWKRDTGSLLYDAEFTCNGKEIERLNDFKIADSDIILDRENPPFDGFGTEVPEGKIIVSMPSAVTADRMVIYDNPSMKDNVTEAEIVFDNGKTIKTGALEKNGSGTEIYFPKQSFESFTIEIIESEGDKAGFTEVEAFNGASDENIKFVKLIDCGGNFVYDYLMDSDIEEFGVYTMNVDASDFSARTDNEKCTVQVKDGKVIVNCPKKEICNLTIECNGMSDTVKISHPISLISVDLAVKADDFYWKTLKWYNQKYYYVDIRNYVLSFLK